MTREEFNKTGFGANMKCIYMSTVYDVTSVNFYEGLIGMTSELDDELMWVRCENIEFV